MHLVSAPVLFLNLMGVRRRVVVFSPSFENFDVFNYYLRRVQLLGLVRYYLPIFIIIFTST
jgi:hypothetical protein